MYGNGRPRPTASGVRTGKIWRRKLVGERTPVVAADVVDADDPDAVLGQRRPQLALEQAALAVEVVADHAADLVERLRRPAPVLQRLVDPGLDLVVQAGDADHEELVEVRGRRSRRT